MKDERVEWLEKENKRLQELVDILLREKAQVIQELQELRQMIDLDFLTGIYSRRGVCHKIEQALKDAEGQQSALCFLDLDNFKAINDCFGHNYGDEVLKGVAIRIVESIGHQDVAGRFGGDEFLIFFKYVESREDAVSRARIICQKVREFSEGEKITASLGVACYPEDGKSLDELLEKADQSLYGSKYAGKNRVSSL